MSDFKVKAEFASLCEYRAQEFAKVRQACQAALDLVVSAPDKRVPPIFFEGFNTANLRCVEVRRVERDDGDSWWQVLIKEATPECPELQAFVRQRMEKAGIVGVEVLTQW